MAECLVKPCQLRPIFRRVPGHKHTAVPIISSTIVTPGRQVMLSNVPRIEDTIVLVEILVRGGATVHWTNGDLLIDTTRFSMTEVPNELAARIHGALYLLPVFLGRFGRVRIGPTGGCQIGYSAGRGARPVTHILSTLECFGGSFDQSGVDILGFTEGFKGADIDVMVYSDRLNLLNGPYVSGVTKTALLAACTASDITAIANPYLKPDVIELARFIDGRIRRVKFERNEIRLESLIKHPASAQFDGDPFSLLSDLSEVMTWITAAVLHNVALELELTEIDRVLAGLKAEIELLDAMAIKVTRKGSRLYVHPPLRIRSVDIEVTSCGIYSDHQPLFALLLLRGDRPARIIDHVWTERFSYAKELCKLGASICHRPGEIILSPSVLHVSNQVTVDGHDLRGAAALLLAATTMDCPVKLRGTEHLKRGFEDLIGSLRCCGALIDA